MQTPHFVLFGCTRRKSTNCTAILRSTVVLFAFVRSYRDSHSRSARHRAHAAQLHPGSALETRPLRVAGIMHREALLANATIVQTQLLKPPAFGFEGAFHYPPPRDDPTTGLLQWMLAEEGGE